MEYKQYPLKHCATQREAVQKILDRFCRINRCTLTGEQALPFVCLLYSRYGFGGYSKYAPPGRLWGAFLRVNYPFSAHEDNYNSQGW